VKETLLAKPATFVDEFAMHDGYLSGGTAEGDEAELNPKLKGLAEWGMMRRIRGRKLLRGLLFCLDLLHVGLTSS
jgi:hypothetical protein